MHLNEYNIRARMLSQVGFGAYLCQNPERFHGGQVPSFTTLAFIINAFSHSTYNSAQSLNVV